MANGNGIFGGGPLAERLDEITRLGDERFRQIIERLDQVVDGVGAELAEDLKWVSSGTIQAEVGGAGSWTGNSSVDIQQEGGGGNNEIQLLTMDNPTPVGGSFVVSFMGDDTTPLDINVTEGDFQIAMEALPSIGAGNIAVTGSTIGGWQIEFIGTLADTDVEPLGLDVSGLLGVAPSGFRVIEVPLGATWFVQSARSFGVWDGKVYLHLDNNPDVTSNAELLGPTLLDTLNTPGNNNDWRAYPSEGMYLAGGSRVYVIAHQFTSETDHAGVRLQVKEIQPGRDEI